MKKLYDLSIRRKFAVVIVPLIVIILAFDYLQVKHKYEDYHDNVRLNKAIIVGIEINHVVHELQKERSISVGFVASAGMEFKEDLARQRSRTDSTIAQYRNELVNPKLNDLLAIHKRDMDELKGNLDKLSSIRATVDKKAVRSEEIIRLYSELNTQALNTVNELINETRDRYVAQQVHAIIYFLKAKEFASIERAIGTQAFSLSQLDFGLYRRFTSLVSSQDSYLDAFLVIASKEFVDFYNEKIKLNEVKEVDRLRAILFSNDALMEDPNYWYQVSTSKINAMKRVEDYMSDEIQGYTENLANTSIREFWSFLSLDIALGLLAFFLMTTIVTNMLKNVEILSAFTKVISSGDLTKKVVVDTKDELGQYANTFNQMVLEIRKSHLALQKERDHAKFMYKNIYGVSLVVFANIKQGIFLLDKDFRISRLYSKAMEEIFNMQKISGENFTSFMRPLILPRELEALEMFMRHLFNPEMDEEVVNQLNPIDQVKIHTESNGVVYSKYIRVNFTRIQSKDKITSIMVTVSDETESVLLQQHLQESEKKKQQETERVLSILKIDPSVLRGFLHNSQKLLKSISAKYELSERADLKELLDFTFSTIHNLKGNSVVIGMELMANKFHEIEEQIVKLRDKEIRGKDFLAILYEIDEADRMMDDIYEMLQKIIKIYKKFPGEGSSVNNIMVVDALERGAEVIAAEVGKNVEVVFKNEKDVEIPEVYLNHFKDVMIQLIRNSVVHGIEMPNKRIAAGKVIKGEIKIELDNGPNNELIIRYHDDGSGLEMGLIRQKAIDRGLVTEFEADKMSRDQLVGLIFKPGFSTSERADRHSGMGQGMHLVKSIIVECKGSFTVESVEGKSFGLTITLPPVASSPKTEES
jgi:signal transduction histidine kinase/HAMP domain-containing protein